MTLHRKAAITGIGQSDIYRHPKVLPFELAVQACEAAIADAGLRPEDIDGVATWPGVPAGTVAGVQVPGGELQAAVDQITRERR